MSYKDLLRQRPSDVEPPLPIPAGPFKVRVTAFEFSKAGQKQTDCVNFTLQLLEPGDEVDQQALAAAEADLRKAKPRHTIFITEDSLWALKSFLLDVLRLEEKDTFDEMMPDTVGKEFIAVFTQQASKRDPSRMVSFIDKVLPL